MRNFLIQEKNKFMEGFTMYNNIPFIIGKIFNYSEYADNLLDGKMFINQIGRASCRERV